MDIGMISDNIIIPRGKHWGIVADGHIIVKGNYIAQAGIAMDIANGVIDQATSLSPALKRPILTGWSVCIMIVPFRIIQSQEKVHVFNYVARTIS
ncbi:hypothetical protein [Paenibacillus sp. OK003]|uniref:hypothetical protein n=1 Tax=Paenibacillus sp. OK003 TaxID=1884380 RepID=UPI0008AE965B|nr:hypothetical protein [Paenibacillus sp. OK003]SEL25460.1 hypothetical protein SAMN05518856_10918 [Paenibacillus sp. OK003]